MLTLVVDALAAYRLTRLIVEDEILRGPRVALIDYLESDDRLRRPGDESKLAYLLQCPHCVSIYVGVGVVVCRAFAPKAWHPVATVLALSAAAGYISEH